MSSLLSDGERNVAIKSKHLSPLATKAQGVMSKVGGEYNISSYPGIVLLTAAGWKLGVCRTNTNKQSVGLKMRLKYRTRI